jgi:Subtilase family
VDPALWAELEGPPDDVIAALMRLAPGARAPDRVRVVTQFGDVATVRLLRRDLLAVRQDPAVASLKAPRTMVPDRPNDQQRRARRRMQRSLGRGGPTGRGAVVGIVDWGCDFTHPNLLTSEGRTRLLALWDQRAGGPSPAPFGYGVVHSARQIDHALTARDPFAAIDYDPLDADEDGFGSHGTHVIDIAAGRPRVGPGGVAPGAQLVFVHLAALSSGPRHIASSVCLLEAIDFIARIAGAQPWVINLSLGSHAGPHDGTTLVEKALDTIVTSGPGRVIVQSCGNYAQRPIHSAGRLVPGERRRLRWHVDPSDRTPNEIELWYRGTDAIAMNLIAPDGRAIARALPDNFKLDLREADADIPLTSTQIHNESSMLANRLESAVKDLRRSDGTVGSILVDKRLATVDDVKRYAKTARDTGRAFELHDIDASLEVSLSGVLTRPPGGADPTPDFQVIADGFVAARGNRDDVIGLFLNEPTLGTYKLYATEVNGAKKVIAEIVDGAVRVHDAERLAKWRAQNPREYVERLAAQKITPEIVEAVTKHLDPAWAKVVREALAEHVAEGRSWKEAVDAHSKKPPRRN